MMGRYSDGGMVHSIGGSTVGWDEDDLPGRHQLLSCYRCDGRMLGKRRVRRVNMAARRLRQNVRWLCCWVNQARGGSIWN
jgi:hypothetical protein